MQRGLTPVVAGVRWKTEADQQAHGVGRGAAGRAGERAGLFGGQAFGQPGMRGRKPLYLGLVGAHAGTKQPVGVRDLVACAVARQGGGRCLVAAPDRALQRGQPVVGIGHVRVSAGAEQRLDGLSWAVVGRR